jgi:membrane protease YdiL (CAAX protease family)
LNQDASFTAAAEPLPLRPPSTLRRLFLGEDGLRAGWSLLLFIALFAGLGWGVRRVEHTLKPAAIQRPVPGQEISPRLAIDGEAIPFLIVLFVTWIMAKVERRPNSVYGLGGNRKFPHFLAGLGWGIVCLSLMILTLCKTGFLVIDRRLLFGADVFRYAMIWLFGFFLVGLLEEYLTRGYVQYTLTRGFAGLYRWIFKTRYSTALGFWTSAIIFSILFGLGHGKNPGESPIGLLSAGLAALVFCLSLWRTGSLWWAIGFHASWDWGQSFLYGVADSGLMMQHHLLGTHPVGKPLLSGGTTGPEGSIFILPVLALACGIIVFALPNVRREEAENSAEDRLVRVA